MCDTIAAVGSATLDGTVLFGKNSDRDNLEAQHLHMIPASRHEPQARVKLTYAQIAQAPETHAVLLSKPHWIWGAEMAANEHGLVVGNEAIFPHTEASLADGIIGMDYLRLAVERASNVDQAIDVITTLLRQHGQSGNCSLRSPISYHNSFLLADRQGAKVLETVDRDWVVKSVIDYYAISNAMTIENDFDRCSSTLKDRAPFSFKETFETKTRSLTGSHHRRTRALQLLAERNGRLEATDLFHVLRDHTEGPSVDGKPGSRICAHRSENPIGQTTAAWVADLTPGKSVHWVTATAAPCTSLFKPVLLETGVPDHGPRPGEVEDKASLWWRHEQLRRALNTASDTQRRAFHDERDALEQGFVEAIANCPEVTETPSVDEARRIVAACWREALAFESKWSQQL